jgi:hypothetical protein
VVWEGFLEEVTPEQTEREVFRQRVENSIHIKKHLLLGIVVHACNPSYTEGLGRRIPSQVGLGKKLETLSEK